MSLPPDPASTDDAGGAPGRGQGPAPNDVSGASPAPAGRDGADGASQGGAADTPRAAADSIAVDEPQAATPPARKRPKPGERRVQILHALAGMLEQPGAERVTTAALAARLSVSEAALYRHFASKAQMFEGLIEFIEQSVFTLVNQIAEREPDPRVQVQKVLGVVLQFGEKNPGMTRVMVGDALVYENERLVARMNQFFDRIESHLRQSLRALADAAASATPTVDAQAQASVLTAFLLGRLQRYARSGFRRSPTEQLDAALRMLVR
jgi:TetR/AcrR family transcriptional regulator